MMMIPGLQKSGWQTWRMTPFGYTVFGNWEKALGILLFGVEDYGIVFKGGIVLLTLTS
jgi:hypothetical protein